MKISWQTPVPQIFKAETAAMTAAVIEIVRIFVAGGADWQSGLTSLDGVAVIYLAAFVTVR